MRMRDKIRISLEAITQAEIEARIAADGEESELDTFDPNALPEAENEITQDLDELDAIATKSEALEQLQVTLESIGSLDAGTTQLANIAYGQIMSGTDMESVSLEASDFLRNVKDSAEAFVRRAKEILAELWRKIQDFIYRVFSFIPRRIKALEELKQQIKDKDESDFTGEIQASGKMLDGLSPGEGKFDFNSIRKAVGHLQSETAFYFTDYSQLLVQTRNDIVRADDIETLSKASLGHYQTLRKKYPAVVADGVGIGRSEYLPGGYVVEVTTFDLSKEDTDKPYGLDKDQAIAAIGFTTYRTRIRIKHDDRVEKPSTLPVLSKREVLNLIDDAISQLKLLESHRKKYKSFCDETERVWNAWLNRFIAASHTDEKHKYRTNNAFGRRLVAQTSFADWSKEPINGLTSVSLRFSAAVAAYAGKCAKVEVPTESTELVAIAN